MRLFDLFRKRKPPKISLTSSEAENSVTIEFLEGGIPSADGINFRFENKIYHMMEGDKMIITWEEGKTN